MHDFLHDSKLQITNNNQEEFLDKEMADFLPSRLSSKKLEQSEYIHTSVVDSQEGPLSRYTVSSTTGKLVSPHTSAVEQTGSFGVHPFEERVRNIESHCGIVEAPFDRTLAERVKILEDKILRIEHFYPQIATHVFNYGKAELEASNRPGGRVSKVPGLTNVKVKRSKPEGEDVLTSQELPKNHQSLTSLKSRMAELKSRLLKKKKKSPSIS